MCRCCGRTLELSLFQINQVSCSDCKKGLDVISTKAGKQAWLKSVKADTKRLRKMMLNYLATAQEARKLGHKKVQWCLATYMETTRRRNVPRTVLMWNGAAVKWWESNLLWARILSSKFVYFRIGRTAVLFERCRVKSQGWGLERTVGFLLGVGWILLMIPLKSCITLRTLSYEKYGIFLLWVMQDVYHQAQLFCWVYVGYYPHSATVEQYA